MFSVSPNYFQSVFWALARPSVIKIFGAVGTIKFLLFKVASLTSCCFPSDVVSLT